MFRLIFLAILLALPLEAWAATCTFTSSVTWTVITQDVSACATEADTDSFVIPDGVTVTCGTNDDPDASEIAWDSTATAASLTIEDGGALVVEDGCGLDLGGGGIVVESGGTLELQGRALTYKESSPDFTATVLAADYDPLATIPNDITSTTLRVGDLVPCGGGATGSLVDDCDGGETPAGSVYEMYLSWPDAKYDRHGTNEPGEQWYHNVLGVLAVGDVLVFWDPTNGKDPSRDVNAHYSVSNIDRVANAVDRAVGIDIRKGTIDDSGYPDELKQLFEVTPSATLLPGDRDITPSATDVILADQDMRGRWLTFENALNQFPDQQALIGDTDNDTADTITLFMGGLDQEVTTSERAWITYGWARGDPISFYRPAYLGSATATPAPVDCQSGSTCDFDFALFDGLDTVTFTGTGHDLDNSWARDVADTVVPFEFIDTPGMRVTRVQVSGGDSSFHIYATGDNNNDNMILEDIRTSYREGPAIFLDDGSTEYDMDGLEVYRWFDAYVSQEAAVTGVLDTGGDAVAKNKGYLIDGFLMIESVDFTEASNAQGAFETKWTDGPKPTVKNGAMVAGFGTWTLEAYGDNSMHGFNLYAGMQDFFNGQNYTTRFQQLKNSSFIEVTNTSTAATNIFGTGLFTQGNAGGEGPLVHSKLLFKSFSHENGLLFQSDTDMPVNVTHSHVAVVDPICRACDASADHYITIRGNSGDTESHTFDHMTLALTPGTQTTNVTHGVESNGDNTVIANLRPVIDPLMVNLSDDTATFYGFGGADFNRDGHITGVICMDNLDNNSDNDANWSTIDSIDDVIADRDFQFVNPAIGNFEQTKNSVGYGHCGASGVGVRQETNWGLKVIHHDAYRHGETWVKPGAGGGGASCPSSVPCD